MKGEKSKIIYVSGHRSPDTDSISSAIAYANYLNKKGKKAVAVSPGKINPETRFVLDYFKVKTPQLLLDARGKKLILLDHNEKTQSPKGIEKAEIVEVIDHHKVNFEYESPIYFQVEVIGSTCSIIAKKYLNNRIKLTKKIAGLLLAGILSDTVIFRSPTTTKEDIEIAKKLAKIAEIKNLEKFGIELKKQKASLKGLKAEDIIFSDFKEYVFGKKKVGLGQIEVVELDEVEQRKKELIKQLEKSAKNKNYDLLLLVATDIIKIGSLLLFWEKGNYIEKAFKKKAKNNSVYLKGVMSRKKQLVPPLTKLFSNR
ncbi:MAG: manganese-dependent inorganic pyrophosphatase [Patescibacteria group bacterium]|nr:manganese-dependent inorganic pyrophosphatase [Patescibacteria group bacterium]